MPRGGKRPGAGRKLGAATKRTRGIADRLAQTGPTPLEVMLEAMQEYYDARDYDRAAYFAEKAAPYLHPRLSSVEYKKPTIDLSKLTDAELEFLDGLYERAGVAPECEPQDGDAPAKGEAGPRDRRTRH